MKCPHCNNSIGLGYLSQGSLSLAGNRQVDEELFCPSCSKGIYWGFRPPVLFFGILLAMWGLSKLDRILMQVALLVPAYIFVSAMVIGISALCLRQKPSMLNLMRRSFAYRVHFMSSYFLLTMVAVQICFLYVNLIPSKQKLTEINDTIASIHRYRKGVPDYILLNKEGPTRKYLFYFDDDYEKKWPNIKAIKPNTKVRILADESTSITEDSYRIWELSTESEIIIPYESMKAVRAADASAENMQYAKFSSGLLLLYLATLYFKRKADRDIEVKGIDSINDYE